MVGTSNQSKLSWGEWDGGKTASGNWRVCELERSTMLWMGKFTINGDLPIYGHHAIDGKINYFDWAIFKFASCQRLPEAFSTADSPISRGPSWYMELVGRWCDELHWAIAGIRAQSWLVVTGTMDFYDFPETVGNGMSSSQLTFTPWFFRGVGSIPPTRLILTIIDHIITIY